MTALKKNQKKYTVGLSLFLVIFTSILFKSCGIKPNSWEPHKKPDFTKNLEINNKLKSTKKISLEGWYGPEDIIFDEEGNMYCGVHSNKNDFSDGKILKISKEGNVEIFYDSNSWVAGLHFDSNKNLIALSHKQGLISISPKKIVTVLANKDENGKPFLIPNGLDIASDGNIYFSNTSHNSSYNIKFGRKLIMELEKDGGLYKYNPKTKNITTLIDGTFFGNGVVLSKNEDFLLITETSKYRILKYWIKGNKKGKTEVFMDNLPGFPNGISIKEDGSFWLGFSTVRNDMLDNIHSKPFVKKIIFGLPEFLQPKQEEFGMILHISEKGEILSSLFDDSGKIIPEAGAVKQNEDNLYIGGDNLPYIGYYSLSAN